MRQVLTVKEAPAGDRPREQLLAKGADRLRTAELIAILIRTGRRGESAVLAGERVAAEFSHRLDTLAAASQGELKGLSPAIGPTAYCQIMAGIELGRRVAASAEPATVERISSINDAIEFCQRHFARLASDSKREEFHIVSLDTKNKVIDTHQISIGTLDSGLVHPREVFRPAIKDAAASVLLVHNHPSGDPTPSDHDVIVTDRLRDVGELLGIEVLDHIIVAGADAISMRNTSG